MTQVLGKHNRFCSCSHENV